MGERVRPFLIVPPATVTPSREAFMFLNGAPVPVILRVRSGQDSLSGEVTLPLPAGWAASPASRPVTLAHAGDETDVRFDVTPPRDARAVSVVPVVTVGGKAWSFREALIDHPHV